LGVQEPRALVAQMEAARRARQAALEAQRGARQAAELAQCTFAPAVMHSAPAPAQVRLVERPGRARAAAARIPSLPPLGSRHIRICSCDHPAKARCDRPRS